jgi:uroporphyrinogen-III decarboxylase
MYTVLTESNRERFARALSRIDDAYRHVETDMPPIVIQDANYSLTGEDPDTIPDDYFLEGAFATQLDRQVGRILAHLDRFDDDYIPFLLPWYGTVVVPSALGCSIMFQPKEEPAVRGAIITRPEDVRSLVPPDPHRDGLMPRVLRCIDYMHANSDLPVSFTDNQGPFNIALNLVGVETIMLWMYDYPTVVHELMDFCTTVLIDWVTVQKEHAGQPLDGGAFPHFVALPKGRGGVWISDDDSTLMSPALYREFVVPYNSRVFTAFGGGTLHYCGGGGHQFENFLATEGLNGINHWCMGDFGQAFRAQEAFAGRIAYALDDFAPLDIDAYYAELIPGLRRTGTILTIFPAATVATVRGRTVAERRDPVDVGRHAWRTINQQLRRRTA